MRTVPLLLMLSAALPAVELAPGFSLGGWGEAFARDETLQENHPRHSTTTQLGETENSVDFAAGAAIKAAYVIDRFKLRMDIVFTDKPQFVEPDSPVLLEQAFIDFNQNQNLTWRAGRFQTTWLGWEGFHTAELWRVNHSAAWDWNVQNHSLKPNKPFLSDGIGMLLSTADDRWHAEAYVVDDLLGDGDDTRGNDKAAGASLWTRIPAVGRVELGAGYDPRSTNAGAGNGDTHAFAIDLNADITGLRDKGWFFAVEGQWHHHPDLTVGDTLYGNDLVLLAMANYAFTEKVSGTVMLDYVERGFEADDNEIMEYALAVLTRPHQQVRFNGELFYWDESAEHADAWGGAMVINLALP